MPQEQALLPYINQAYGQNVQAPDMSTFQETFTKDSERKREEFKSVTEIGIDLDAESYRHVEKGIKKMLEEARRGDLKVGSAEWQQRSALNQAAAGQMREEAEIRKGMLEEFMSAPDQMSYLKPVFYPGTNEPMVDPDTGEPEMVDVGKEGYLADMQEMINRDYENPMELVNERAKIHENVVKLPVPVQQGLASLRRDASTASKQLLGAGETDLRDSKQRFGNVVLNIRTTASDDSVRAAISSLIDQHGQTIAAQWSRMGGSQATGMTKEAFIADTIQGMLQTQEETAQIRSDFSSRGQGRQPQGVSPREIEVAKNVKPNVARAQSENNPSYINEYLRGNGFEARSRGGMWEIVEYGKSKSEDTRVVGVINPNNANEIYDAIAENNKNISRDAIDMFTFDATPGSETPQQREVRSEAETYIDTLFNPDQHDDDGVVPKAKDVLDRMVKRFNLDGVQIISEKNKKPIKIKIDGTEYDLREGGNPDGAYEALMNKIMGKTDTEPEQGVGAKYNPK